MITWAALGRLQDGVTYGTPCAPIAIKSCMFSRPSDKLSCGSLNAISSTNVLGGGWFAGVQISALSGCSVNAYGLIVDGVAVLRIVPIILTEHGRWRVSKPPQMSRYQRDMLRV